MKTTENVKRQNLFPESISKNNNVFDEKQTKLLMEDSIKTNDLKIKRSNEAPTEKIDNEKRTENKGAANGGNH